MPRFFFHVRKPAGEVIYDREGSVCGSFEAALVEAEETVRDMRVDLRHDGVDLEHLVLMIADENGRVLDELPFSDLPPQKDVKAPRRP